jgi:hypothetical protein
MITSVPSVITGWPRTPGEAFGELPCGLFVPAAHVTGAA